MNIFSLINPAVIIGLASAVHIEAAVEYLKSDWKLPTQLAPYVALVFALAVNFGIADIFHLQLTQTLVGTFLTTGGAAFWHEFSTPSK